MITFEKAVEIASKFHNGQKDLDNLPVLLHPLAVALKGTTNEERIVGVLHDVVEDTDCSLQELEHLGVDKETLNVLELLTHDKSLTYDEYLKRIVSSGNMVALKVKRNDLMHNISRNDGSTVQKKRIKDKHRIR